MEMILTDPEGIEQREWMPDLDLDNGDTNDFEITIDLKDWEESLTYGCLIFVPGTEYGGMIGDIESNTLTERVTLRGDTWRGMLTKKVIEPPTGEDYRIVSGNLHEILKDLIEPEFSGLFQVPVPEEDIEITYQFDRYCTLLAGLQKMLDTVDRRLQICYRLGAPGKSGYVEVTAVPRKDYSEEVEFSQDGKLTFRCRDYRRGYNHMIALGKGELKERLVLHLYESDGVIGKTQICTGAKERTIVYELSNEENAEALEKSATEKFKELLNYKKISVSVDDIELEIGDMVAGRDYVTGIYVRQPITQKILRITDRQEDIEYKVKGEE